MERSYISVELAARLLGRTPRLLRQKIADGALEAQEVTGTGGNGGTSYRIPLDELPFEAQILYWSTMSRNMADTNVDLVGYKAKYGEGAIAELLQAQTAVRAAAGLRQTWKGRTLQKELDRLADTYGTTLRTLYRWEDAYAESGLAGLMRKGRSDAGMPRTMCYESRRQLLQEYLAPQQRTMDTILEHMRDRQMLMGPSACEDCPNRRGSDNRDALVGSGELRYYPECDRAGSGILVPGNRSALNRVIASVSEEEKTYMRKGRKAWEAKHMCKATREKPNAINKVWFGDHGQFDVFCIDHEGHVVRPWITLWFDAGSGYPVGWTISTNPNSRTITQAFARAAAAKRGSPVRGVPEIVYVDNGKDYRCEALEGNSIMVRELGQLDRDIGANPLYDALSVRVMHAKAYHGWVKPVERFFRTLWEKYCRDLPGYCGGSIEDRPENFELTLRKLHMAGKLLTIDELAQIWIDEILPAYLNREHEGYGGRKPIDLYNTLPRARDDVPSWSVLALVMTELAQRKVSTQGVKFRNRLYWSPRLMHMAGEEVMVRYDRDDLSNIIICTLNGQYVCSAEPKELMRMVDEDPEKVAIHVAMQRVQEREVRERLRSRGIKLPGKRASGHVYFEDVDETHPGNSNIVSMAAQAAANGQKELERQKEQRAREGGAEDRVAAMFRRLYEPMAAGK